MSERTVETPRANASWWTPLGWLREPEPESFHAFKTADFGDLSWEQMLRKCGYEIAGLGNQVAYPVFQIAVREYCDQATHVRHLFIEIEDPETTFARMFVAEENIAAFFFDKLPSLLRTCRQLNDPPIGKAIVGFVRHGHGETVICEDGLESREERSTRLASERHQRARREAEKAAGGAV